MSIDAVVSALSSLTKGPRSAGVEELSDYFANVIQINGLQIAVATDGVGTKILLANRPEHFHTIALDCAAMNVNDIICVGAQPLALVDYLACETTDGLEPIAAAIAEGFLTAQNQGAGGVIGGEVALLPDIIAPRHDGIPGIDLAATAIGIVEGPILDGSTIESGDVVIGIASSGIHSNGFTRLRQLMIDSEHDFDEGAPWGGPPGREQLLVPTLLYPNLMSAVSLSHRVHAAAHITGGGITNLARALTHVDVGLRLTEWPELPPVFAWIAEQISLAEAFQTFNMGIGFCVIVARDQADDTLARIPNDYSAMVLGTADEKIPAGHIELTVNGSELVADRNAIVGTVD